MSTSALLSAIRAAGRQRLSASTVSVRWATGCHLFQIDGYTQVRSRVPNGTAITSCTFRVGGHDWRIACYPNGETEEHDGYISLFLQQVSHAETGDATATFKFSVLNQSGEPSFTGTSLGERCFSGTDVWGLRNFLRNEHLNKEEHLKDDCLIILCDVAVDLGLRTDNHTEAAAPEPAGMAPEPPFDFNGQQILEAIWYMQTPDVKIEVGGETFPAHRWVLEARSPVFMDDLALASDVDNTTDLRVDDMDADVFRTLLQFIYTDTLPDMSQLEASAMADRLLAAADRYKIEKLKLICQDRQQEHRRELRGSHTASVGGAASSQPRAVGLMQAVPRFFRQPDGTRPGAHGGANTGTSTSSTAPGL
ncbi:BTB/POZ and MATH domain-containing protein 1-like [Lolium rigidum]|uniref:BTB/POZ and MATH domain-containing protein 1-like n=1 Tax=Lolium rigidum TaxID=89674 RepID=UPI001F5D6EF1|nr:BTB/POZ and MATH domain-containing protein 1-like [Lolium rigidum]